MTNFELTVIFILLITSIGIFIKLFRNGTDVAKPQLSSEELEDLNRVYNLASDHMVSNKIYLKKSIKVQELACEINEKEKSVSKAINYFGNGNFNSFVNGFRIEHSKTLITSGKMDFYTIEAIADESGFSNKVSFYQAFKSNTGMSPTEYRAQKQS